MIISTTKQLPLDVLWVEPRPEERWWLFGMTAMSTGGIEDGDKSWRLALSHALSDVAQNDRLKPRGRKIVPNTLQSENLPMLDLFGDEA